MRFRQIPPSDAVAARRAPICVAPQRGPLVTRPNDLPLRPPPPPPPTPPRPPPPHPPTFLLPSLFLLPPFLSPPLSHSRPYSPTPPSDHLVYAWRGGRHGDGGVAATVAPRRPRHRPSGRGGDGGWTVGNDDGGGGGGSGGGSPQGGVCGAPGGVDGPHRRRAVGCGPRCRRGRRVGRGTLGHVCGLPLAAGGRPLVGAAGAAGDHRCHGARAGGCVCGHAPATAGGRAVGGSGGGSGSGGGRGRARPGRRRCLRSLWRDRRRDGRRRWWWCCVGAGVPACDGRRQRGVGGGRRRWRRGGGGTRAAGGRCVAGAGATGRGWGGRRPPGGWPASTRLAEWGGAPRRLAQHHSTGGEKQRGLPRGRARPPPRCWR